MNRRTFSGGAFLGGACGARRWPPTAWPGLPPDRRHRGGRHPVPPQQRRIRRQVSAGNPGPGLRLLRLRWRWLAGHSAGQWHGLARPSRASAAPCGSTATTATAPSPTSPSAPAWRVEMYGMGVAIGDYNNDGFPDLLVTAVGQNRLFQNNGRGRFHRRHREGGPGRPQRLQHVRDLVRFRSRRPARSAGLQLREVVAGARRLLQRGRQAQVLLHAGGLSRRDLLALPQSRRRHL